MGDVLIIDGATASLCLVIMALSAIAAACIYAWVAWHEVQLTRALAEGAKADNSIIERRLASLETRVFYVEQGKQRTK